MTSTSLPRPALVPGRAATTSGLVRQALVEALIGAVRDELAAGGVVRASPAVTKTAPTRKISTVSAEG